MSKLPKSQPLKTSAAEFDWVSNLNAFHRVEALLSLPENWDSYGASRFEPMQVKVALGLCNTVYEYYLNHGLNFTEKQPFVAPGSDGSILFEWSGDRFTDRELEISVVPEASLEKSVALFEYLKTSTHGEQEGHVALRDVQALLDWLFAK